MPTLLSEMNKKMLAFLSEANKYTVTTETMGVGIIRPRGFIVGEKEHCQ